jgi:hypothetical protein
MQEMDQTLLVKHMHLQSIPREFQQLSFKCIDFVKKCFLEDSKARWTCKQLLDHPFLRD